MDKQKIKRTLGVSKIFDMPISH